MTGTRLLRGDRGCLEDTIGDELVFAGIRTGSTRTCCAVLPPSLRTLHLTFACAQRHPNDRLTSTRIAGHFHLYAHSHVDLLEARLSRGTGQPGPFAQQRGLGNPCEERQWENSPGFLGMRVRRKITVQVEDMQHLPFAEAQHGFHSVETKHQNLWMFSGENRKGHAS